MRSFFPAQVATVALGLLGALGLLLSIAGTFGLASYTVSKRLHELSFRVALGGQAMQVFAAALGRILILLASGSWVGLLLGVAASRVLSVIVFQATAQDPVVLAAVAFTILLTGTLSVAGPVRRAIHVDPAHVLEPLTSEQRDYWQPVLPANGTASPQRLRSGPLFSLRAPWRPTEP